ncbi:MAG: YhcH/YjgK/YiaL family protein [Melioribacteraceae bacterium]|nr:YhcH/YjgK/YiaL family protein [Melioribacteraceae bacterium]
MIFDQLKNAHLYFVISDRVKKAFDYLVSTDFENLEPGRYDIEGNDIYAIVQQYDTKPLTSGKWEAHKKYLDIQYMVNGKEKMGYSHKNKMIVTHEYNEGKDALYLKGDGNFLVAEAGYFAIFFPSDVHMPCIALNLSTPVKKVVVKVKFDYTEPLVEKAVEQAIEIEQPVAETESVVEEIKNEVDLPETPIENTN